MRRRVRSSAWLLPTVAAALAAIGCGGGAAGPADGGRPDVPFDPPEVGLDGGTYVPVPGNCGFDSASSPAAFCETFEAGPTAGGRAGELDPARWSAVRSAGIDTAFGGGIGKALLPQCRPGLTDALVLPDGDTVICDPTTLIPTRHLMTATAAQNYGLNTYRIRQPFDFAGRTGTIKLDVDLTNAGLLGWSAIAIAQDPSPTPSFDFPERGSGPRNGFEIEFMGGWCNTPNTVMPVIYRYRDYLNRYPGAPKRDYARYQFALCYDLEHEKPDRDQTATREAIDQYRNLIREFPDSGYAGAGRERIRVLTDLLAEHDFGVGYFYLRKGATASALGRFTTLEERFPDYGAKDKLYYYHAKALERLGRKDEAQTYYGKIVQEFPKSDYVKKVKLPAAPKEGQKPPETAITVDTKPQSQ